MKRLALSLVVLLTTVSPRDAGAGDARSYVSGNVMLEIDGASAGFLRSAGPLGYTRWIDGRLLDEAVPSQVDIRIGFGNKLGLEWIAGFLKGAGPKDLRLVSTNYKLERVAQYDLATFAVSELQIPPLDASSKEVAYLRVRGQPRAIEKSAASGQVEGEAAKGEKLWLGANFRVTIDGVDTTKIAYVSPITVTRDKDGLTIAPFELRVAQESAGGWFDWSMKTLKLGQSDERTMRIDFLAPNRQTNLASFELTGVTPVTMSWGDGAASEDLANQAATFRLAAKSMRVVAAKSGTRSKTKA